MTMKIEFGYRFIIIFSIKISNYNKNTSIIIEGLNENIIIKRKTQRHRHISTMRKRLENTR